MWINLSLLEINYMMDALIYLEMIQNLSKEEKAILKKLEKASAWDYEDQVS